MIRYLFILYSFEKFILNLIFYVNRNISFVSKTFSIGHKIINSWWKHFWDSFCVQKLVHIFDWPCVNNRWFFLTFRNDWWWSCVSRIIWLLRNFSLLWLLNDLDLAFLFLSWFYRVLLVRKIWVLLLFVSGLDSLTCFIAQ